MILWNLTSSVSPAGCHLPQRGRLWNPLSLFPRNRPPIAFPSENRTHEERVRWTVPPKAFPFGEGGFRRNCSQFCRKTDEVVCHTSLPQRPEGAVQGTVDFPDNACIVPGKTDEVASSQRNINSPSPSQNQGAPRVGGAPSSSFSRHSLEYPKLFTSASSRWPALHQGQSTASQER